MADHAFLETDARLGARQRAPVGGRRRTAQSPVARSVDADTLIARYVKRPLARILPVVVALAVATALAIGWVYRDEGHLTAESGTGYWLGIAGSSAMLLLLIYPMRKRMPRLRFLGTVPFWFKIHMMLGIVGPLLIVFHSNFKLSALNSNVAFFSMLVVAGSGVIGRYIYGKVHLSFRGRKAAVQLILDDVSQMQRALDSDLPGGKTIIEELTAFAKAAMTPPSGALAGLMRLLGLTTRSRVTRSRLLRQARVLIADEARRSNWSRRERRAREAEVGDLFTVYFTAVNKAAKFGLFERLFALWHVLHLPLFFLLIAAALVHVLAVHLY